MPRQQKYHDVMLAPRLKRRSWRGSRGRYYPTGTKELHDGSVEVRFYLPPSVLREWQSAIGDGKKIRLFIPQ